MLFRNFFRRLGLLDLQVKIILVLISVILPTYLIVILIQNKLTIPLLEQDMRQIGIDSGKNIAVQIENTHLFAGANPEQKIENLIQETFYWRPSIARVDVVRYDDSSRALSVVASNVEHDASVEPLTFSITQNITSEFKINADDDVSYWEIVVPIKTKYRSSHTLPTIIGAVRLQVSLKSVDAISDTFWKISVVAALVNVILLIIALSYFLRKTITNDRLLRKAESQNLELAEQLDEARRQLMNSEKLAVMGQLTASFAHEIGTPLNAVGGHIHLLNEELAVANLSVSRLGIIRNQLEKIENIVKSFLQSTAKPSTQSQLVDIGLIIEKTVAIVRPRIDNLNVQQVFDLDKSLAPLRVVPLDIEQILLNILTNSLDSMDAKRRSGNKDNFKLEIATRLKQVGIDRYAEISVTDTGEGISKINLKNVFKPFFTTKRVGEGTGLGLSICMQLAEKYSGKISIDSKEGLWTRVTLQIPYHKT